MKSALVQGDLRVERGVSTGLRTGRPLRTYAVLFWPTRPNRPAVNPLCGAGAGPHSAVSGGRGWAPKARPHGGRGLGVRPRELGVGA